MAKFVLCPCKLREGWATPIKDADLLTLNWKELCQLLAPSRDRRAMSVLRLLQAESLVGLTLSNGVKTNFVLTNLDRSGDMGKVLKQDKTFASRLISVYRVVSVEWDSRIVEIPGAGPRPRI
jgi:hypothetical protein